MLEELNARFLYRYDGRNRWRIMKERVGSLDGDASDYIITALWFLSKKSVTRLLWNLLTFNYVVYTCARGGHKGLVLLDMNTGRFLECERRVWSRNVCSGTRMGSPVLSPLSIVIFAWKRLEGMV